MPIAHIRCAGSVGQVTAAKTLDGDSRKYLSQFIISTGDNFYECGSEDAARIDRSVCNMKLLSFLVGDTVLFPLRGPAPRPNRVAHTHTHTHTQTHTHTAHTHTLMLWTRESTCVCLYSRSCRPCPCKRLSCRDWRDVYKGEYIRSKKW